MASHFDNKNESRISPEGCMSMIGKTLGHYAVSALIGRGGMGEVYRAKDQKLGRDVAIKVLPDEFARDADRVARFQREAKLLASLNHPNLAAIYGFEESNGTHFLVLELIEGDTLTDRINARPIPVEESLILALQIAEALEAAHEKGVIHRDLKPANIKVTPDGKVKILDFGLAKAFAGEQEDLNLSNSPTLSVAATQQGVILGTAAYMSPEQAKGKPVDKRADVWAFGCVVFEMLTGRSVFAADDVSQTLARVLERKPDYSTLPPNLHPKIIEMLERCLEKDPRNRYGSVSDARVDIQKALDDPGGIFVRPAETMGPRARVRHMLPWLAAVVALSVIVTAFAVWKLKPVEPRPVVRFDYELPEGRHFSRMQAGLMAISPDGSRVVYSTDAGLYLRSMDDPNATPIIGADKDAAAPFFSSDGQWIGYCSAGKSLKKISVRGGAPAPLCDDASARGSSWGTDNSILFVHPEKGIMRVSANGGTSEVLVKAEGKSLIAPQLLPDGKSVLFTLYEGGALKIIVQLLKSGERRELIAGDTARYLPTGHIVYSLDNNLFAVPFDLGKLKVTGGQVLLVEGIYRQAAPQYAVSDSGTMVYVRETAAAGQRTLVWVDQKGREEPLAATPNSYGLPRISPDGTKVALTISTGEFSGDIWTWDFIRENMTRLTFNEGSVGPVWTPDGKRIAFASTLERDNVGMIYWKAANGIGEDEPLGSATDQVNFNPGSWSNDGKTLVTYGVPHLGPDNFDIGAISIEGDRKWKPLLNEKYNETMPEISPDGRWMAYMSDESGQYEIYVRPFPEVNSDKWQVSQKGGMNALWSPDGRKLFYRSGDAVMAVPVGTEPTFKPGRAEIVLRGYPPTSFWGDIQSGWDIHPDGKRFLMLKPVEPTGMASEGEAPRRIHVVLNWFEELKQRVPKE
jgi:Tol biopolymer transport system component